MCFNNKRARSGSLRSFRRSQGRVRPASEPGILCAGTVLAAEEASKRDRVINQYRLRPRVRVADRSVRGMRDCDPKPGAAIEAVSELDLGTELEPVAKVQVVGLSPPPSRRDAGGDDQPATQINIDQDAGAQEGHAVGNGGRGQERLEDQEFVVGAVIKPELAAGVLLTVEIEITATNGQKIRIIGLGRRRRQANDRKAQQNREYNSFRHGVVTPPGKRKYSAS